MTEILHKRVIVEYCMIPFTWSSRKGKATLWWKKSKLLGGLTGGKWLGGSMRKFSRVMVIPHILTGVWVTKVYKYVTTHHMKHVKFMLHCVLTFLKNVNKC